MSDRPAVATARPKRAWLQLGASTVVLALVCVAGVRHFVLTHSSLAVITARVVSLRAPIDGVVSGLPQFGEQVAVGASLAQLVNDRVDDQEVLRVNREVDDTRARVNELESLTKDLGALDSALRDGAKSYQAVRLKQLSAMEQRARARIAAEEERTLRLASRLERGQGLEELGLLSKEAAETLRSERAVGLHELTALNQELEAIKYSSRAARSGVLVDPGGALSGSEKSYAGQRADDIQLRLKLAGQELTRELERGQALERHAKALNERVERLRNAALESPVIGRVAQTQVANGEFVIKGQELIKLSECNSGLIVAVLNERSFNRVTIGTHALVKTRMFDPGYSAEVIEAMGPFQTNQGNVPAQLDGSHYLLRDRYTVLLRSEELAEKGNHDCTLGGSVDVEFDAWGFPWE